MLVSQLSASAQYPCHEKFDAINHEQSNGAAYACALQMRPSCLVFLAEISHVPFLVHGSAREESISGRIDLERQLLVVYPIYARNLVSHPKPDVSIRNMYRTLALIFVVQFVARGRPPDDCTPANGGLSPWNAKEDSRGLTVRAQSMGEATSCQSNDPQTNSMSRHNDAEIALTRPSLC